MENTQQTFEDAILEEIKGAILDLQQLATAVNRGPGGREVALAITNMQQAQFWLIEAKSVIAKGGNP